MKPIYLDYGATSPVRPEVLEEMLPYFKQLFANSGSLHDQGIVANQAIERAREKIASALGASTPREIIFTSSGTEANNLAILGVARKRKHRGNHIITTQIEHPSVLEPCRALEREGFEITYLPVDEHGKISIEHLISCIREETILVSIMAANNEVGTIQPICQISPILKEKGILLHSDAIQFFGKEPFTVDELGVDLLSIASHKIYGPKGAAALYIRRGIRLEPIFYGGGQERGIRPSTLNTPAIVGFAKAAELAVQEVEAEKERLSKLRDLCFEEIIQRFGSDFATLNGHPTDRLCNNLNFSFHRIEGQAIMLELNRYGISISSGSACSAGKHRPSHVLKAMGRSDEVAHQSVRITLGKDTMREEIRIFVEKLAEVLQYFQQLLHNKGNEPQR